MKKFAVITAMIMATSSYSLAADRTIEMSTDVEGAVIGEPINFQCAATGADWQNRIRKAIITIIDGNNVTVVDESPMSVSGKVATYDYVINSDAAAGDWSFSCLLQDRRNTVTETATFSVTNGVVVNPPTEPLPTYVDGPIAAHNTITAYNGPATCISCHQTEATQMLDSLHMQWAGPTPMLTNGGGEELGKGNKGINTFCTYAPSSKGACYSCHVRADGNAPHQPEVTDIDCLMCHSDTYQRKFVEDPNNTETVTNILGETKTYVFGAVDAQGNYTTVPDYDNMPAGTNMVNVARTVHMPTNKSCLRCHAKAGGGDWTKRGDLGLSSANATFAEDVHLAQDGANLSCVNCHSALDHNIGGRGIDLRQTEAAAPTCKACHTEAPHNNVTLNQHAQGQVSCQVCHITEFAKGGATEMSRDWRTPVWNPAFCSGQGGFVGEEIKEANVKPEYVWFDGTSYVYNVGETITPDENGVYNMAKAHGKPFDGNSSIVPTKRHKTIMPLHESGEIVPPAIMWMFMTGDFDQAVQKGMEEQGLSGTYSLVEADAEMLITHGVDPIAKAPACSSCHDGSGATADGTGMLPFTALGYHEVPAAVNSCTLCHEKRSATWQSMHQIHRSDNVSCSSCHTSEPTGFVKPQNQLCSSCHDNKSWRTDEGHKKHFVEKHIACTTCHTFS